jgi:ComF family protein
MADNATFSILLAKKIKKVVLDTLFPLSCLKCGKENYWLCPDCLGQIKLLDFQFCACCEKYITEKGALCPDCKKLRKSSLDSLTVAVSYEIPEVKKLVHYFKYRFVSEASIPLSKLMTRSLVKNDSPLPDVIVPVPLHPKRLRQRGFNQSRLLAEKISVDLAPLLKLDILDALARTKNKKPQMEIKKYRDRLDSVKDIFSLKIDCSRIENKKILLIDDIATTGATLEECAKVLKKNGARKVFAAVISRQTFHPVKFRETEIPQKETL